MVGERVEMGAAVAVAVAVAVEATVAQICMASTGGSLAKPKREIYLFSYTFCFVFP